MNFRSRRNRFHLHGILQYTQNAFSKTVLNLDNEISNSFSSDVRGQLAKFSKRNTVTNGAYLKDNKIVYSDYGKETEIIDIKDIFIPGMHNV